jgi:hypothetical protein
MQKILNYLFIGLIIIASLSAVGLFFLGQNVEAPGEYACTMDAMMCPDGSAVGRVGPSCEFAPCPGGGDIPADVQAQIDAKNDLIVLTSPQPGTRITSPVTLTGKARGYWFFEASFPISVVNWDGLIIGEGIAQAQGEWMTEDFIPFTATIDFTFDPETPYNRGALILKKDNPSGDPSRDDALEIPVTF